MQEKPAVAFPKSSSGMIKNLPIVLQSSAEKQGQQFKIEKPAKIVLMTLKKREKYQFSYF